MRPSGRDYEDIKNDIAQAPDTWLPALLQISVMACWERKVFKDGPSLLLFVEQRMELAESSERNREALRVMYRHLTEGDQ